MELNILLNQSSGDTYPFEHNPVIRTIGGGGFSTTIRSIYLTEGTSRDNTLDLETNEKWTTDKLTSTLVI
jgi:hypothetical protein